MYLNNRSNSNKLFNSTRVNQIQKSLLSSLILGILIERNKIHIVCCNIEVRVLVHVVDLLGLVGFGSRCTGLLRVIDVPQ